MSKIQSWELNFDDRYFFLTLGTVKKSLIKVDKSLPSIKMRGGGWWNLMSTGKKNSR